jgi:hypothetical protein
LIARSNMKPEQLGVLNHKIQDLRDALADAPST